jgi:3-hydroxyisobutyrate dehydrogenase-like beta-hydroxyacid dehydrogenase
VVSGANGLLSGGGDEVIVIETSTLPIEEKRKAHRTREAEGVTLLDCPISGTGAQAVTKDLMILGSGDRQAFDRCVPVFDAFARAHTYLGPFGNGSKMKFVANLLINVHNVAAAEAMVLGMKAGLDPETIYAVISDSAATSRMFELRGPMMVKGAYDEATMTIETWQKDS